jgi:adenylate kinase
MSIHTFVLMAPSGAGKGTQAKLLFNYLKSSGDEQLPVLYVETGPRFREFIKLPGYCSSLSRKINEIGGRQPDFLAIWNWTEIIKNELKENMHMIIDGAPRSLLEAQALQTAFQFYNRGKVHIIYLDVSSEWAEKHLLSRKRFDDLDIEHIRNKINWFEKEVRPAVDFFRNSSDFNFLMINGEQEIQKIHQDIISQIKWQDNDQN